MAWNIVRTVASTAALACLARALVLHGQLTAAPEPMEDVAGWLEELNRLWQQQLDSFKDYVALRKARPEAER